MTVRKTAFRNLCDVMIRHEYASLNMRYQKNDLSAQDRRLLTQLVYGTLRNYRYVRYQWNLYVDRMENEEIAILMDMSTYQLMWLDRIPAYACINEAVEIAKDIASGSYTTLVNAVLHKISNNGPMKITGKDELDKFAIETSHPTWLVKMWDAHYGRQAMEEICWDDLNSASVELRANSMLTSKEELLKDERFTARGEVLTYEGDILSSPYFTENKVIIQSASSQKVAEVMNVEERDRVLDVCSAPGTKCVQMAMMAHDKAEIIACDIYPQRVKLIDEAISRYNLTSVKTMCIDGRNLPVTLPLHYFNKVLLDAPCSGLGTLKHKPEIKISLKPEDIDDIVLLQQQLLEASSLMVKEGGILVYSTCTLNRKENDRQIALFLSQHSDFSLESEQTIFPYDNGSDGFYIAKLRRNMIE